MSGRLVGEVIDWLQTPPAEGLTMAERMVLLVIAERAHEKTREMWRHRADDVQLVDRIAAACRLDREQGLKRALQRLAARGLDVRVPYGTDKRGRPIFAARGRSMRFRLPELPAAVSLPEPVDNDPSPVDNPPDEPVGSQPSAEVRGSPASRLTTERGSPASRLTTERGSPASRLTTERGSPASRLNPSSTYPSKEHPSTGLRSLGAELEVATTAARDPTNDLDQVGDYEQATRALQRLPDLGAALITQARTQHPDADLRQLVIHAAHLAAKGVPA